MPSLRNPASSSKWSYRDLPLCAVREPSAERIIVVLLHYDSVLDYWPHAAVVVFEFIYYYMFFLFISVISKSPVDCIIR